MGMHNTSNLRKRIVKYHMCGSIGRWIVFTLNFISFKINNNHIFRCQFIIIHTAWFDDKKSLLSVDAADISPGKCNQAIFRQIHVCFVNFFF